MALTNYEKQKRWRDKNRALYNLQQRNRRKKGGDVPVKPQPTIQVGNAAPKFDPESAARSKIEELRDLMQKASAEPTMPAVKPQIFKNDYGNIISEAQWKRLQAMKEKAKAGNYVLDEYSQ